MINIDFIRKRYNKTSYSVGAVFLLNIEDSLSFLNECYNNNIILLGVESFRVWKTGEIQPEQDYSNDIADCKMTQEDFYAATIKLIREAQKNEPDMWFEIVVEENK